MSLADRVREATLTLRAQDPEALRWVPESWSLPHPRFVWDDGFARNLAPVVSLCESARDEALPADALPCAALARDMAAAKTQTEALAALPAPLSDADTTALRARLLGPALATAMEGNGLRPAALDALLGAPPRATSPDAVARWAQARDQRDTALAAVEVQAVRVLMAYGWQQRGRFAADHWKRVTERDAWMETFSRQLAKDAQEPQAVPRFIEPWPKAAADVEPAEMARVLELLSTRPADEVIATLRPAGDQYVRLVTAHRHYREIVEAGGFQAVPDLAAVRPGKRHAGVPALRTRLAQEGFPTTPADAHHPDALDGPLQAALMQYQELHLVRTPKPQVGPETRKLMSVAAEVKLERIATALAGWRATLPRPDYYVQVNIPDYNVEVWRAGKRLERIRVVVGSGKRKWEDGKAVRPNATPSFHAEIRYVVYQPYWNIPKRILDEEVLDEDARQLTPEEQVSWLEGKGYEVVKPGSKWQYVRQLPGVENPLGQVKILFPNAYDVYLHDTPAKALFNQPVRAYSHGCMRVQQPLRLARTLLEQDGRYDDSQVTTWLRGDEQQTVGLAQAVPIFVEYIPLRVDEQGRTWFLPDVYDRLDDRAAQTARN